MLVTLLLLRPTSFCATAGQPWSSSQWAVVCAGALGFLYLMLRSGRKRKGDPLEKGPMQSSLAQQRNVERQMQNLLVELSEMARQITAQLDTRSAKLAMMIDDADDKAARLQRLIDDCRTALAAVPPTPAAPAAAATSAESTNGRFEEGPSIALPHPADPRHQQIYDLADQGHSTADIARDTDRPRGEVELILALRPTTR